jgi:hypothetical protein
MAQLSSDAVVALSNNFSNLTLRTRFERFILGTYDPASNSQTIQIVTINQRTNNSLSPSSPFRDTYPTLGFVKCWVNVANPSGITTGFDVENVSSGNPTYTQSDVGTSFTRTFSGRINSLAVFVRGTTGTTSNQLNLYSGNMTFVNSISDFNFIDATPSISKLIKLPPITAESSGKLYFYKIKGIRNRNVYIYTYDDSVFADYNESGILLKDNYACATLFNDGVKWYIANYYPSPAQSYLPAGTTGSPLLSSKVGTASTNTINIFNTNGSSNRQNSNNLCMLPALNGNTAICTVIYAGNVNRLTNNGLIFSHYDEDISDDRSIDNNPAYNVGGPCIIANETSKSNGIVFISDGTVWYIAGWFFGAYWGASTSDTSSPTTISIGDLNSHTIRVTTTSGSNIEYRLPQDTPSETPYFLIVKGNPTTSLMKFNVHTGDRFISENLKIIQMDGITPNICTWFVRQVTSGVTRYYPVISYTPSAPL